MNAEERKELEKNSLIATVEKVGAGLKEGPSRRTMLAFGVVVLIGALIGVIVIVNNLSASRNSERWLELETGNTDDLRDKHKNTPQGRALRLQDARNDLAKGRDLIFRDYAKGKEQLASAGAALEALAGEYKAMPIQAQLCLLGAAEAYESCGDFAKAEKVCDEIASRFKDSKFAAEAAAIAERVRNRKKELEATQEELKRQSEGG